MLVTCICVCHNKPDIAPEAIESIVNQSYPDWEALVVDSGVLYDAGYYDRFTWRNEKRVRLIRSAETEEIRRTKAMAPWCFNECFRNGLVSGDLVMYLCDDDILYPNAFETFVSFSRANPQVQAMYASQDIGVIYPTGWRSIVGERRATQTGGKHRAGRPMDCHVDYLQFCHGPEVLKFFPEEEYWPEGKDTESHADGIFMERIGEHVAIYPIDVKVSQNRRTMRSTYNPAPPIAIIECMANGIPLTTGWWGGEVVRSCRRNTSLPPHGPCTLFNEHSHMASEENVRRVTVSINGSDNQDRLWDALASLEAQAYLNLEVLVLDEGSTNGWPDEILQAMKAHYPRCRLVSGDAARDRGLWEARGTYFITMDAGTHACPDMVERFVTGLRARLGHSALTCYVVAFPRGAGGSPACGPAECTTMTASMKNIYNGGIYHTEHLRAVGGFGTDLGQGGLNWSGFLRLVNAGYPVDILPEHLFYYGHGDHTQNSAPNQRLLQPFFNADRLAAAERVALWGALSDLQERLEELTFTNRQCVEQLTIQNQALQTRLRSLRYRIADRMHGFYRRLPIAKHSMKWLASMLA